MKPLDVRVDSDLSCTDWLRLNGYVDIVMIINDIRWRWKMNGNKSRRDWWLILAGTPEGHPKEVAGYIFPVLKSARRRQGFPPDVPGAIQRGRHELAPLIRQQKRWGKTFKRALR